MKMAEQTKSNIVSRERKLEKDDLLIPSDRNIDTLGLIEALSPHVCTGPRQLDK